MFAQPPSNTTSFVLVIHSWSLQEYEDEARDARRGIFVYGDPGDSDDDAPAAAKPAGAWGKPR